MKRKGVCNNDIHSDQTAKKLKKLTTENTRLHSDDEDQDNLNGK